MHLEMCNYCALNWIWLDETLWRAMCPIRRPLNNSWGSVKLLYNSPPPSPTVSFAHVSEQQPLPCKTLIKPARCRLKEEKHSYEHIAAHKSPPPLLPQLTIAMFIWRAA